MRRSALAPWALVLLCALPFFWAARVPGSFLADALGELPIKLYCYTAFWRADIFFGGFLDSAAYPQGGQLNNPDPVATLVVNSLRPALGVAAAYNAFICLQLLANALATWALARDLLRDELAALTSAVAFAFTPLVLVYCVNGAITDMLNLWPYPLALMFLLRALRRPGWRDAALGGLFAGLGFFTCPYNFVVFLPAVLPVLAWLAWTRGRDLTPVEDPEALLEPGGQTWRQWAKSVVIAGVVAAGTGGVYALRIQQIMADGSSMMSEEIVGATRHVGPSYPFLWPPASDRYMAYLSDYFAVGVDSLVIRDLAARLHRAFSPGYLVMALMVLGLVTASRKRAAALWPLLALFFALASAGPYLPWSRELFFASPVNPVWIGLHEAFPGSSLLLEPFRYALVVALGLSVGAGLGARWLIERLGPAVGWALPALVLAEVALVSPVPMPPPTTRLVVSEAYTRLDEVAGPGALIELPYTLDGTALFNRMHFLNQTVHGRPIVNEVPGFLPRYLTENQFTARLLAIENQNTQVSVPFVNRQGYFDDAAKLREAGFAAIVVEPERFRSEDARSQILERLESQFGPPKRLADRLVFVLIPPEASP
ncbi:MAG: glycosyltransferase family 39 protein [Alphaproteobacteria bacterium]|nr:glycosyltransferase family 39 protein [Alphaproteobacteria bacterium]